MEPLALPRGLPLPGSLPIPQNKTRSTLACSPSSPVGPYGPWSTSPPKWGCGLWVRVTQPARGQLCPKASQGLPRARTREKEHRPNKEGLTREVERKPHPHKMLTEGALSLMGGGAVAQGVVLPWPRLLYLSSRTAGAPWRMYLGPSSSTPVTPLSHFPLDKQAPRGDFTKCDKNFYKV